MLQGEYRGQDGMVQQINEGRFTVTVGLVDTKATAEIDYVGFPLETVAQSLEFRRSLGLNLIGCDSQEDLCKLA